MKENNKVVVLGGGSFGTVLANLAASNGYEVSLWVRDAEQALRINSEGANTNYHPELKLSDKIEASDDLKKVIKDASVVLIATPSSIFENITKRIVPLIDKNAYVISCTKGILSKPFRLLSDVISSQISNDIGVLSGPNLAKEIAESKVAGTVIASHSKELILSVKSILSSDTFKIYSSQDMEGVELAGALKNIYAIISGYCHAVDVGENAIGLILTRALAEMGQFAKIKGASFSTFLGLAGVGDLVATCFSKLSRNYQLGWALGNGLTLTEAKETVGQVAEGLNTLEIVQAEIDDLDIKMPLLEAMHGIIYKKNEKNSLLKQLIMHSDNVDVKF